MDSDTGFPRLCHSVSKNIVICAIVWWRKTPQGRDSWMDYVTTISKALPFPFFSYSYDTKKEEPLREIKETV